MSACTCGFDSGDGDRARCSSDTIRRARKAHRCCECRETIPPGDRYEVASGLWDGEWVEYKTCLFCVAVRTAFSTSWRYTCLWEDMADQVFDCLTTASECFRALPVEYREPLLAQWRQWKGLED